MNQKGQVLVSILIIIAITVLATGAALVATSLSRTTGISTQSDKLLYSAESGVEEALIRLLRDPNYFGDNVIIDGSSVQITVVPGATPTEKIIKSIASSSNLTRGVEVYVDFNDNIFMVTSWKQIL